MSILKARVNDFCSALYKLGTLSGCHQLPERSFFYKGKQFPVCARCTGVFFGYAFGILSYRLLYVPIWVSFAFFIVMFADWFIQRIDVLKSTNIRRFITGGLGGFAVVRFFAESVVWFIYKIESLL